MYRRIVVGTDGSQGAMEAVRHAIAIAKAFGAPLDVVSATRTAALAFASPEAALAGVSAEWDAAAREATKEALERAAEAAQAEGVNADAHDASGDPADVLCSIAEQVGADLIVVGNRGMTGARRFLLGSVPNKVSHHAPCSVLIVHTT